MKQETKKQVLISVLDEKGHEIPDPQPLLLEVDIQRPPTLAELVKQMVRYEVSSVAEREGLETFEEADDFDVGDEPELRSQYELDDEQDGMSASEFVQEQAIEPENETEEVTVQLKEPPIAKKAEKRQKKSVGNPTPTPSKQEVESASDED